LQLRGVCKEQGQLKKTNKGKDNMNKMIRIVMMVAAVSVSASAFAATDAKTYVGGYLGFVKPDSTGSDARIGFALDAVYKFVPEMGAGAFLTTSSANNARVTTYGLEGNYYFGENVVKGLGAGLRLGMSSLSSNAAGVNLGSAFTFGFQGFYDYFVASNFSVGGEFSMLFVGESDIKNTAGAKTGTNASFNMINVLAAAKYHF
jgi:hypothetical protein